MKHLVIKDVSVVVHAQLEVDGEEFELQFRDLGNGKLELVPECGEHAYLIESGALDSSMIQAMMNDS